MSAQKESFWDGTSSETKSTSKSISIPASKIKKDQASKDPSPRHFGPLFFIVTLAVVLVVGVVVNFFTTDDSANKLLGTIDIDNGDQKINWDRYPTTDIELNTSYTITTAGTYHFTGAIADGAIAINAGDNAVRLIFDNISIANSSGPAVACYAASDLVIELIGENYLQDGAAYSADYDEDVTGALYSKDDLTFSGAGSLEIIANYQDGIVAKDDLKFISGSYNISAQDDGIRGKDSVYILAGDFVIDAKADAIKSTNEIDAGKGFVLIEDGNFTLTAGAKGIKAINSILFRGGKYEIVSYDDALHSNNYIGITNGAFDITSGDDGIHADRELVVDGGKIQILKSYEGLEAQAITINDGNVSIVASDDGINAGGGADSSATNRVGAGAFDVDTNCIIAINGGNVYVNASGDGIDSNGWLYFNGGTVIVDGPTNNGNGALDAGASITMNGGEVIAVGASGMAETLGSDSTIYNISVYFTTTQKAGTAISIRDAAGTEILNHTSAKTFNHLSAGSELFGNGEVYTIYLNDVEYQSFTISGITTIVGASNNQSAPGR